MEKNVGNSDKWLRLIMAALIFPLLFVIKGPVKWAGLVSVPLLGTALMGRCGLYAALGINTCKLEN
ncbi:MAG: DUF2892 domain-containing protein [Alkalibacterium sp.]|nr:DUF2892 domain-containing protein [Alkalibacterium sp.]TVP90674.1 MAG: DUF2892 domain-containing protein [Alkalibacterium sp.]